MKIYVRVLLPQIFRGMNCKIPQFWAFLEKYTGKHIPDQSVNKK
jgi:hypothetical protein